MTYSPIPVPEACFAVCGRAVEQREQGARVVAGAGPAVEDRHLDDVAGRRRLDRDRPVGAGVLGGVAEQVVEDLPERGRVRDHRRQRRGHLDVEQDRREPPGDVGHGLAERTLEHHGLGCQLDQAALDAGQHQQVVGDPPQPFRLVDDVRHELRDVLAVRVARDDGRRAVDARDRRPELVGHDGEERLRRLPRMPLAIELQRLVALLVALGRHVAVGPDQADRSPVGVRDHPGARQHVVDRAVRKHDPVGEREGAPGGEAGTDGRLHGGQVLGVDRRAAGHPGHRRRPAAGRRSPRRAGPSPLRRSGGPTTTSRAPPPRARARAAAPARAARPRQHAGRSRPGTRSLPARPRSG